MSFGVQGDLCLRNDPIALGKFWKKKVLSDFWNCIVFPIFDLGDLALCPDREAEKAWKDCFGQGGLLKEFQIVTPESSSSWGHFRESIEEGSLFYAHQAELVIQDHALRLTGERAFVLEDALEYGWVPDLLQDFHRAWKEGLRRGSCSG